MNNPELLKCPCCGDLPDVYQWGIGSYWCHCARYSCNFPYSINANTEADAIRAWNDAVIEYKESKNE